MKLTTPLGPDDRRYVRAVAKRIVRDPADVEDVTQDALLAAYRHRDSFRGDSHYRTWLYRIAWTTALAYLRRERRRARHADALHAWAEVPTPEPSALACLTAQETIDAVQRAIDQLPPAYAETLRLRLAGHTESAVAKQLRISLPLVKVRAHRARHALRPLLADELCIQSPKVDEGHEVEARP